MTARPNKYDRTVTPARIWVEMLRLIRKSSLRGADPRLAYCQVRAGYAAGTYFSSRLQRWGFLLRWRP